ncbi:cellulase family glycosylhydrolase [Sphaerobacter thermophilus]|uniref:cellulase family glycosylhydrolase n=1 Tax=Sphaerobacter thermophilus TaxID=2057 RepID=UPI0039C1AF2E
MRVLRWLFLFVLLGAVLAPTSGARAENPSAPEDLEMPRYFAETGFWVQGPFRKYWETRGGLFIFGYPITGVFEQDGLLRQYFERAVFEYHPEFAGTPYEVLLMRLGAIRVEGRESEEPFQPIPPFPDNPDHRYYAETGHSLSYGFKNYWDANGGLMNFGFPLSQEFDERNQPPPAGDGEVHTVQYFERARFEWHPEYRGTPYEVLLGLLGTEYLQVRGAPEEALARQDPTLPPPDPIRNLRHGPHVGYGFNVFLWGDDQSDALNQKAHEMVKDAGFSWVRVQAQWRELEPAPGSYNPSGLDRIVDSAARNGVKLLVSVVKSPEWAGANGGVPEDPARFEELMRFLAERYRGRVHAWEIWNEQNLAFEMGGYVDIERYVNLLKAGYTGVKAGDPSAIVVFGGLTPTGVNDPTIAIDDVSYLRQIYSFNDGEVKQYYDVLGAHPGSNNNPPDALWPTQPGPGPNWRDHESFYFRRIEQLRQVMIEHGEAGKQIWLTEFGWTTANQAPGYEYGNQISEEAQAEYLVRAFQMARQYYPWMGVMFVWNLNFSVVTPPEDEKHPWSVLYSDWTPRPSYTALQQMPK